MTEGLPVPSVLDGARPKGDQLREVLEEVASAVGPGGLMPSERVLAERYGVARMTVRQEVDRLAGEGVLVKRPGRGTFVTEVRAAHVPVGSSFTREMRARGLVPGARIIEATVVRASPRLATVLETPVGDPVLRLVRVRTADGEPMAMEKTAVSLSRFPGLDDLDFEHASLYDELERKWAVRVGAVSAIVTAVPARPAEAKALGISPGKPCLAVESSPRSTSGKVIEAGRSLYRADRYEFVVGYRL